MARALALVLSLFAALLVGCPDNNTGTGGDGGASADAGGKGGGTGGVVDLGCSADQQCASGEICDLATGDCVAGLDCSGNPGRCSFCDDASTGCGFVEQAYCDDSAGVCRRPKSTCGACASDAECGRNEDNGLPNKCIDGFCAEGCGQCPAGFQCTSGGCVPAPNAGSCDGAILCPDGQGCPDGTRCSDLGVCLSICDGDGECPAGKICWLDPGPLLGQCIDGCPRGETRTVGGVEEVCHANGRFGPLCPTEGATTGCPAGLECGAGGVCLLPGCQSDNDCNVARTYCDTTTGECVEGCNSDDDCGAFELCETATNTCKAQGCRGKDVSCNLGEWCCGHEVYDDASTCPAPVAEGECFLAPDPWCRTCEDNDDCADIDNFGFPSFCYELTQQDENGEEVSLGKFCSVGCNSNLDCPRGIPCQMELPTDQEGVTTQGCLAALCAGF